MLSQEEREKALADLESQKLAALSALEDEKKRLREQLAVQLKELDAEKERALKEIGTFYTQNTSVVY